jgi:sugar transferase (PEP-CTERM/EpsH1 system associated)
MTQTPRPAATAGPPLVAHLVYSFQVGGLENGIVNLINHMPAERYRHVVIALTHGDLAFLARIRRPGVELIELHKGPGHGFKLYPRLYRLLRRLRPAIVHTRNLAALEMTVPAWVAGVPARVHGEHGWDTSDPAGQSARHRWLRRLYAPFVSHYVALSGHLRDYLVGPVGIAARRVSRICNGVDGARFRPGGPVAADFPFSRGQHWVVGAVGRLQEIKDPVNLVGAFGQWLATDPEARARARLVLVGDGALGGAVAQAVAAAGVGGQVWLAGERADVPALMAGFDCFALPSRAEGISNTLLEAMASGLPVVATDVGGNRELVVDGQTGALVPPQDPAALAAALATYFRQPELARQHGAAGRARVEAEFSLESMVGSYLACYDRLLGRDAARSEPAGRYQT